MPISQLQLPAALALVKPISCADLVAIIAAFTVSCLYLTRGKVWDKPDPLQHLWFEVPQLKDGFKKKVASKETTNIAEKLQQLVGYFPVAVHLVISKYLHRTRNALCFGGPNQEQQKASRTG